VLAGMVAVASGQNMSGTFVAPVVPVGSLSQKGNIGVALGGQSRFFPIERLATGFNASFQYYFGRNDNPDFMIIPIRGTVEYFFTDEGAIYRPFAGVDLGLYITTHSNAVQAQFGVAPGGGISFELSDYISIQLQARYNFLVGGGLVMFVEPSVGFSYTFY